MGSEVPVPEIGKENATVDATENRCPGKTKEKVPRKIHKAEREKMKREQLNELFLDLANSLELTQPNNGKASVLCEATRLLKDLSGQIECLKKENASLLSESHYLTVEKNELKDENSVLESQIEKLQSEVEERVAQSKPDLNAPPPDYQQSALPHHFRGEPLGLPTVDATMQQAPAVLVIPFHPDLPSYPVTSSHVSKPHARYPTPADSWPSQLLAGQLTTRKEVHFSGSNDNPC